MDTFDGRTKTRRDADDRNCQKCGDDDDGFFQLHGDTPFPFENAIEAFFGVARASHGDALPPDAPRRGFESGIVTGVFGEVGETAIEPPAEWAEPEDCAVQQREALGECVAASDVRNFMREDRVEFCWFPFAPRGGQQDGGMPYAEGHWDREEFRFGEARC